MSYIINAGSEIIQLIAIKLFPWSNSHNSSLFRMIINHSDLDLSNTVSYLHELNIWLHFSWYCDINVTFMMLQNEIQICFLSFARLLNFSHVLHVIHFSFDNIFSAWIFFRKKINCSAKMVDYFWIFHQH